MIPQPGGRVRRRAVAGGSPELGTFRFYAEGEPELVFCENETNVRRLYGVDASGPFKDGIGEGLEESGKEVGFEVGGGLGEAVGEEGIGFGVGVVGEEAVDLQQEAFADGDEVVACDVVEAAEEFGEAGGKGGAVEVGEAEDGVEAVAEEVKGEELDEDVALVGEAVEFEAGGIGATGGELP